MIYCYYLYVIFEIWFIDWYMKARHDPWNLKTAPHLRTNSSYYPLNPGRACCCWKNFCYVPVCGLQINLTPTRERSTPLEDFEGVGDGGAGAGVFGPLWIALSCALNVVDAAGHPTPAPRKFCNVTITAFIRAISEDLSLPVGKDTWTPVLLTAWPRATLALNAYDRHCELTVWNRWILTNLDKIWPGWWTKARYSDNFTGGIRDSIAVAAASWIYTSPHAKFRDERRIHTIRRGTGSRSKCWNGRARWGSLMWNSRQGDIPPCLNIIELRTERGRSCGTSDARPTKVL